VLVTGEDGMIEVDANIVELCVVCWAIVECDVGETVVGKRVGLALGDVVVGLAVVGKSVGLSLGDVVVGLAVVGKSVGLSLGASFLCEVRSSTLTTAYACSEYSNDSGKLDLAILHTA
jgi:hypothetical protein